MMMVPRRKHDYDVFDEMFKEPFFNDFEESKLMRTDIKEKKDKYVIDMDLPGYSKENIQIQINNGYLLITAKTDQNKEDKEEGKFVHRERFIGECSRSFYVGDEIRQEDVKASFRNGTLELEIPKKEERKELPEQKYIQIDD